MTPRADQHSNGMDTTTTAGSSQQEAGSGARRLDGKATAALIMGVLSLTVGWCGLGILLAPLAIVLGLLSMRDSDRAPLPASNRGAATAGVITGIVGLLLLVGFIVLAVVSDSSSA